MKIYLHALSLFVLLFLYGLGSAAPVAIGDASFEGNTLTSGQANSNLSPEWQVVAGGAGFFLGNEVFTAGFAADGTDHLALLSGDQVWQDLGETFQANTVYTLKVAVGALAGFTEASNSSTYALGVGGTIYATASYNASQLAAGSFADAPDLVFDTAANPAVVGQPIRITLSAGGSGETYFDHLRLTTSFSQPAGTAVVVAGSASQLDLFSATLSGVVFNTGVSAPSVTFFYGTSDGGNNPAAWDSSVSLAGAQAAFSEFTVDVSALLRGQPYFFRVRASNAAGDSWSSSAAAFTTPDGLPVVNSFAAVPIPLVLGEDGTLSWQVTTAASAPLLGLSIDNGIGDVFALTDASGAGSIVVSPSETTTYSLVANTIYGFVGSITTLTVTDPYATRINEFLANSGSNSLPDEDGDLSDWIELYNPESVATDLSTYYLTDDISQPRKWAFPAVTLNPGEYMLVFASGKDRAVAGSELHTNFSLSSGGEYLALTREDGAGGVIIEQEFAPTYPEQEEGVSYGVGDNGTPYFFKNPSPGRANLTGFEFLNDEVVFSHSRGVYEQGFQLELSAPNGFPIYYTRDGSVPTSASLLYNAPVSILPPVSGNSAGVVIIRAIAPSGSSVFKPIKTHTYLFPENVVNQSVMESSITQDSRYGPLIGDAIQEHSIISITMGSPKPTQTEEVATIEIFNPKDPNDQFKIDCGIKAVGNASIPSPKNNFRLYFRKRYGAGKFNFPVFPARNGVPAGEGQYDRLDLRSGSHDSFLWLANPANPYWSNFGGPGTSIRGDALYMRNRWINDMEFSVGNSSFRGRWFQVFLNGTYHGQYHLREFPDDEYCAENFGGESEDYEFMNSANPAKGGSDNWQVAWQQVKVASSGDASTASEWIDLENLINYMLVSFYSGNNWDWNSSNNWRAAGSNAPGQGGWRFFSSDQDVCLQDAMADNLSSGAPGGIFGKLMKDTDFQVLFRDLTYRHCFNSGSLTYEGAMEVFEPVVDEISLSIIAETARWQGAAANPPWDKDDEWMKEVRRIRETFMPVRTDILLDQFRAKGWYPVEAPELSSITSQNSQGMTGGIYAESGTILYTTDGSDPRVSGGSISGSAQVLSAPASDVLVGFQEAGWSWSDAGVALSGSGIVAGANTYDSDDWKHPDFAETGWDQNGQAMLGGGQIASFPINTQVDMGPDGQRHPTIYFRKSFDLSNPSDYAFLALEARVDDSAIFYLNGREIGRSNLKLGEVFFDDLALAGRPEDEPVSVLVPLKLDDLRPGKNVLAIEVHQASLSSSDLGIDIKITGIHRNLVLTEPTLIKARVRTSAGEWSAINQALFVSETAPADTTNLVISEVHYHPLDPTAAELAVDPTFGSGDFEFIEIMNTSNQTVDLSGAAFVKIPVGNDLDGVEFTFPDGAQIAPGERQVIVANAAAFAARYPGVAIAGEYSSGLSNGGEWITLHDAEGEIIDSFRYNDKAPWPVTADGDGYSLILNNPASQPNPADPSNWSASQDIGGSPGASDGKTFTGDPLADLDGDGRIAILEYAQGNSDDEANNGETLKLEMTALSGENYATVSYREDPSASDVSLLLETSTDLTSGSWTTNSSALEFIETTADPDGIPRHTYRTVNPVDLSTRRFFRLKVVY